MIYKDGTDEVIEHRKARLGLTGDVYIVNEHFIESLVSHKRLIPASTASTIEEAEAERIAFEQQLEAARAAAAAEAAENAENVSDGEIEPTENTAAENGEIEGE